MVLDLGSKIRLLRRQKEMTQNDLADRSGVSFRAIQKIEDGTSVPRADTLSMLGQALGVTVGGLLDEAPIPPKPSPSSVTGPLTAEDGALILARLASATPAQRALALTILFEEPEFLKDFELPKELVPSILGAVKVK